MNLIPTFSPPPTSLGTDRQSQHDRIRLLLSLMRTSDSSSIDFVHSFEPIARTSATSKRSHQHTVVDLSEERAQEEVVPGKKSKQVATLNSSSLSLFDGAVSWSDRSKELGRGSLQVGRSNTSAIPDQQSTGISSQRIKVPLVSLSTPAETTPQPQISQPASLLQTLPSQREVSSGSSRFSVLRSFKPVATKEVSEHHTAATSSSSKVVALSSSAASQSMLAPTTLAKNQNSFLKLAAVFVKAASQPVSSHSTLDTQPVTYHTTQHSMDSAHDRLSAQASSEKAKKAHQSASTESTPKPRPVAPASLPPPAQGVFDAADLLGLDWVCRNAAATSQGFHLFHKKMLQSSLLAVGILFRDLTTNHAVTSVKYCTPSVRCALWHCTCERVVRGDHLRGSHVLAAILMAQCASHPTKDPAVYFLPLVRCVEPEEGEDGNNGVGVDGKVGSDVVLPIKCEVNLHMRRQALQAIFQHTGLVKMVYHVQVACLPLHHHLQMTRQGELPSLFDPRLVAYLQNPDVADAQLELHELLRDMHIGHGDVAGLGKVGRVVDKTGRELKGMLGMYEAWFQRLQDKQLVPLFAEVETKTAFILSSMEYYGVLIDTHCMPQIAAQVQEELHQLEKDIQALAGVKFNISSPEQLSKVLFEAMQIQTEGSEGKDGEGDGSNNLATTEKKKHFSTSEEELVKMKDRHPIISLILDHRVLSKMLHTYLEGMMTSVSKRPHPSVHPIWNQTSVRTGRLSCAKPNMQNIPNAQEVHGQMYNIRSLFYASEGHVFVCADYSQIEMRVLAHLTQDPTLLGLFRQEGDIYNQLASRIFRKSEREIDSEERNKAKVICLGVLYGMGAYAIAAKLKMDVATAAKITQSFFNNFANIKVWINRIKRYDMCFVSLTLYYISSLFSSKCTHNADSL
ncbi:hypothetical protein EON65_21850 [archaeon]|nr:MAG: hypothetical protein EON65_21850 [archaeon]